VSAETMVACSTWLVVKDVLLVMAALAGAVIGALGLTTWWRQLSGQADFDLARRIVRAAIGFREGIRDVRNNMIWSEEMFAAIKELGLPSEASPTSAGQARGVAAAYQVRWKRLADAYRSLGADAVEAEALWDVDLRPLLIPLHHLKTELLNALQEYTREDPARRTDTADFKRIRDMMSQRGDDEFDRQVVAAVDEIVAAVRPYLPRRRFRWSVGASRRRSTAKPC